MKKKIKKWQKVIAAIVLVAFLFQCGPVYALDQLPIDTSNLPAATEMKESTENNTEAITEEETEASPPEEEMEPVADNSLLSQLPGVLPDGDDEENNSDDSSAEEERKIVGELEDMRESNVKYFLNEDNTITACSYESNVHYEAADGTLADIDNTLVDGTDSELSNVVANKENAFSVKFAKKAKEKKLAKLTIGNETISWGLENANKKSTLDTNYVEQTLNPSLFHENDDPRILDSVVSYAKYGDIQTDTDLEYVLNGTDIKENIILNSTDAPGSFSFLYTTKGLCLAETENGIEIRDRSGNPVSEMKPLVMSDAELEASSDITMALEIIKENNNHCEYRITITPSAQWLQDPSRVYPVTIDPTIVTSQTASPITANFVSEGSSTVQSFSEYFQVGTNTSSHRYMALIKTTVPSEITPDTRIVNAEFSAIPRAQNENFTSMAAQNPVPVIEAHSVNQNWEKNTVLWDYVEHGNNGGRIYSEELLDYDKVENRKEGSTTVSALNRYYTWDVTRSLHDWTKGMDYHGILLKMPDSFSASKSIARFYTSTCSNSEVRPVFNITYINMVGLEDYWTYHSQDAGIAGSGYVNDFTGALTASFEDVSFSSEKMPFTLSHVYNGYNAGKIQQTLNVGSGWQLSIQESIEPKTIGGETKYKYTDGDGTEHYFEKNTSNVWKDDSGLDLTLTIENDKYTISDKKDNCRIFSRDLTLNNVTPLSQLKDNHDNTVTMNFTDKKLTSVTDSGGRTITFHVDSSNNSLSSISWFGDKTISYTYEDGTDGYDFYHKLVQVKYPGQSEVNTGNTGSDNIATYTYSSSNTLTDMVDNNKGIGVHYDHAWINNSYRRVTGYCLRNGGVQTGYYYGIEYRDYITKYCELNSPSNLSFERFEIYTFNTSGQTTSAIDQDGNAIYTQSGISGGAKNKVTFASKTQRYTKNYMKNHNCETTGYYSVISSLGDTTHKNIVLKNDVGGDAFNGSGAIKAYMDTSTDMTYIGMEQNINVPGGYKYTFSAHIKTNYAAPGSCNGANIGICSSTTGPDGTAVSKSNIVSNDGYTRHQVTIDLTDNSSPSVPLTVSVNVDKGYGLTYFDCLQLEQGGCANPYNYIENGDFDDGSLNGTWQSQGFSSSDGFTTDISHSESYSVHIKGDPSVKKYLMATIPANVKAGEGLVFGTWIKTNALPHKDVNGNGTAQGVGMTVELGGTTDNEYGNVLLTPTGNDWLYICGKVIAKNDHSSIKVYLKSNFNANDTYFDDVTVFKDSFGESFSYDNNGNIKTVVDLANERQEITSNQSTTDITSYKDPAENIYRFTYNTSAPKKHELLESIAPDNTSTKMSYDQFGNLRFLSIYAKDDTSKGSSSKAIRTETRYDSTGTHITATIDPRGKTTNYTYGSNDLLTSVSDPNNANSKTEYQYDLGTDKLTKVKHNGMNNTVSYGYSNEQLTKVMVGTLQYNFAYNALGNLLSAGTSSYNLETYSYNNRNLLSQTTFGNGQVLNYTYDNQDRIKSISNADGRVVDYDYNNCGNLGSATYYSEGSAVTTDYQYDFADRYTSSYNSKGFGTDTITYDKNNNNTGYRAFLKQQGAVDLAYLVSYEYNNVNALTKMTAANFNTVELAYDNFDRVSEMVAKCGSKTALKTNNTYLDASNLKTTNLLDTYKVYLSGNTGTADYSYKYTYDDSGNIKKVVNTLKSGTTQTVSYEYDKLNQLTSVSNYGNLGLKDSYTFDERGNITGKTTTNASTGANVSSVQYRYSTAETDQLTHYGLYNANGALVDERLYQYDGEGNVSRIMDTNNQYIAFGWDQGRKMTRYRYVDVDNTYYYNESGLVSKLVKGNGSSIEYFYDDGQLEFEVYRSASGGINRIHKYFYDDDGTVRFIMTSQGTFGNSNNYSLYAYVYDGAGNVTDLVKLCRQTTQIAIDEISLAAHYEYDAYGRILSATNYNRAEDIAKFNPIRYKGYYYETDTSYYRLDSRYYDPAIGRFINADNISLLTETPTALTDKNLYSYCDNNPVMRKDSEGEVWNLVIGAGICGAISAGFEIVNQIISDGKVSDWGAVGKSFVVGAVSSVVKSPLIAAGISGVLDGVYDGFKSSGSGKERALVGLKSFAVSAGLSLVGTGKAKVMMEPESLKHGIPKKGSKNRGAGKKEHWTKVALRSSLEESVSMYYAMGKRVYSQYNNKKRGRRYNRNYHGRAIVRYYRNHR